MEKKTKTSEYAAATANTKTPLLPSAREQYKHNIGRISFTASYLSYSFFLVKRNVEGLQPRWHALKYQLTKKGLVSLARNLFR